MAGAAPYWHRDNICVRYRDTRPSEAEKLKAGNAQASRSAGRSVGVCVWGLVRRVLSAKKKRYKYVTMLFGRETVWDEPACLEGDETVSMFERFKGKWESVCAKRSHDG